MRFWFCLLTVLGLSACLHTWQLLRALRGVLTLAAALAFGWVVLVACLSVTAF